MTDDMSPMQTYLAGGGDTTNERTMALLFEAERGYNRRQDEQRDEVPYAEQHAQDEHAREVFLTYCRPATPAEYKSWLDGYRRSGGDIRLERERWLGHDYFVLESAPETVPSLYGSLSVNVIVPAGVLSPADIPRTFHGCCGHSSFFFVEGFEFVGLHVTSFQDI
jgi:hypothetical protein